MNSLRSKVIASLAGIGFVGLVVGANALTANYALIPAGFGLLTTAGTYLAGATFVLRDVIHEHAGRWVSAGLVAAAAVVAGFITTPALGIASGVTFLLAELLDLGVYDAIRKRGYMVAVAASSAAGALLDSWLFLTLAGFPVTFAAIAGQVLVKGYAIAAVAGLIWAGRLALSRKRI